MAWHESLINLKTINVKWTITTTNNDSTYVIKIIIVLRESTGESTRF